MVFLLIEVTGEAMQTINRTQQPDNRRATERDAHGKSIMSNFILKRKQEWDELEKLVRRASGRHALWRMSPADLTRLDVLYRRATVDLAQVSSRTDDLHLRQYLNQLVASAHSIIYLPQREPLGKRAGLFVLEGFARVVARQWRYHLVALLLTIGGTLAGYEASMRDPAATYALMPDQEVRRLGAGHDRLVEYLRDGRDQSEQDKSFFAAFLFSNNFRVAMIALAAGVLGGIPTILLLVYNGMILGVFIAVHHSNGIYAEVWAWLLPHGITEIGAIILCGGVGLLLGRSLICPGRYNRLQSLNLAGREGFRTVMGAGIMLFFAALIESFLRQSHLTTQERLFFAGATLVFWIGYFTWGAFRESRERRLYA